MMDAPQSFFVGKKLSRVCWFPDLNSSNNEYLVSGSYDSIMNGISFWRLNRDYEEDAGIGIELNELDNFYTASGISSLKVVDAFIFGGTNSGDLHMLETSQSSQSSMKMKNIMSHKNHGGAVMGIDNCGSQCISVAEDGKMVWWDVNSPQQPPKVFKYVDSLSIEDVIMSNDDLFTCNVNIKFWDLRCGIQKPSKIFSQIPSSSESSPIPVPVIHCMTVHPNKPFYLFSGAADGSILQWDTRMPDFPFQGLSAHTSHVWDMKFHRANPRFLASCSQDSQLLLWEFESKFNFGQQLQQQQQQKDNNENSVMFDNETLKVHQFNGLGTLSLNSLDISGKSDSLAVATDSQSLLIKSELSSAH